MNSYSFQLHDTRWWSYSAFQNFTADVVFNFDGSFGIFFHSSDAGPDASWLLWCILMLMPRIDLIWFLAWCCKRQYVPYEISLFESCWNVSNEVPRFHLITSRSLWCFMPSSYAAHSSRVPIPFLCTLPLNQNQLTFLPVKHTKSECIYSLNFVPYD